MGKDDIFKLNFETVVGERLQNWFHCDITVTDQEEDAAAATNSVTIKVKGVLYVSTHKLAFSSDNPAGIGQITTTHQPHHHRYLKVLYLLNFTFLSPLRLPFSLLCSPPSTLSSHVP